MRGLWLLRKGGDDVMYGRYDRHATPMFVLKHGEGGFRADPFGVPLDEFVRGALTRRLVCWPRPGPAQLGLVTVRERCWKCRQETSLLLGAQVAHPQHEDVMTFVGWDDEGKEVLRAMLTPEVMRAHGLGVIKPRASRTGGEVYLSQGCAHCGALQGDFFIQRTCAEYAYDDAIMRPRRWEPVPLPEGVLEGEAEWHLLPA